MTLSPIERFVYLSAYYADGKGHSNRHYMLWRHKRQAKLLEILGHDLRGMTVLALGDGLGDMGGFVAALGADVVALEGRPENVALANLRMRQVPYTAETWDLHDDFTKLGRFAIVLNLGLLEVIDNVPDVLEWSCAISNRIIIDTLVCDSDDQDLELARVSHDSPPGVVPSKETIKQDDGSLRGTGSRPTSAYIEQFHTERGYTVHRHWTADLNSGLHVYDWAPANDGSVSDGKRRFWEFVKT